MLTHSRRRLLLPVLICLVFLLLLPLISLGEEENSFTVTKDGESSEYDFFDPDSALCLLYTSPSPRDISGSRMPSSA